jgi:DNA topoisomerase-1
MARALVIVESPAKAKTINKYLGRNYTVKASLGHVKDLPKKELGVVLPDDNQRNASRVFEPTYEIIPGKIKVIHELKKSAREAGAIYLATDPDREGEAIAAHLVEVLSGNGAKRNRKSRSKARDKPVYRVLFHEITPKAIQAAFARPGRINQNLVDAQQARRVLDRLVGYQISPLLWEKVRRGLSAGRVQTVALRLIVEREREIRAFVPREYWTIHARLAAAALPVFEAKLITYQGKEIEIPNEAEAQRILQALEGGLWQVEAVQQKEKRRYPPPPFTTSKLQQEAYNKLRFTAKRTMALAQRLYEGVELGAEGSVGLITYMRTDSVRVADEALAAVRRQIADTYGPSYLPEKPNLYKSKKSAQEAHEAIRPTDVTRTPDQVKPYLDEDLWKLYQLIWRRFVASQMVPAVFDQTTIDVAAGDYRFRASGAVLKFDGFLAVLQETRDEAEAEDEQEGRALPQVSVGERLQLESLRPQQHFTEPPPRYTEATLVKTLEEKGIGRPSTYATIISTLVEREYVTREQGRFKPTRLGEKVSDLLVKSFEDIFDVTFTARMEEELDEIEEGKLPWKESVREFYHRFEKDLEKAADQMASYKAGVSTGLPCEKCGQGELLERISRHGFFLGCSRYPECDFTRDLTAEVAGEEVESESGSEYCENCGREMTIKRGRFGPFLACTGYPECKTTRRLVAGTRRARQPDVPLDEHCPECGSQLVRKHGRYGEFVGCSAYPKCKYLRAQTLGIKCPKCGEGELVQRMARKGRRRVFYGCNRYPGCDFTTPDKPVAQPCPKCGAEFVVEKKRKEAVTLVCLQEGCGWQAPAELHPRPAETTEPAPTRS